MSLHIFFQSQITYLYRMLKKINRLYNKIVLFCFFLSACAYSNAQSRVQELTATQFKQNVIIRFVISPGNSCSGYQIQRSNDSLNFEVLYDYVGICGELNKPQTITYTDKSPLKNVVNYYRILIPPSDFSNIVSVFYHDISENGYLLFSNPITKTLLLQSNFENGKLKIYNQKGGLVKEYFPNENGIYSEDISSLPGGLYYFIIETDNKKTTSGKFIKE